MVQMMTILPGSRSHQTLTISVLPISYSTKGRGAQKWFKKGFESTALFQSHFFERMKGGVE